MDKLHSDLFNALRKSKICSQIWVNTLVEDLFFEECLRALNRNLVITLCFSEKAINEIEKRPFSVNKLMELRNLGASVFITNNFEEYQEYHFIAQLDFTALDYCGPEDSLKLDASELIENFQLASDASEYRSESGDIKISFNARSHKVFKGEKSSFTWEAFNALTARLDGLGELPIKGEKAISLNSDSILIFRAENNRAKKSKAVFIEAIDDVEINYDISFLNPASKQFVSLKDENNYEGVFGVAKGHKIELTWEASKAEEVNISPFGLNQKSGEHIFQPNGSLEISIQASLHGRKAQKRIIIHEFPMPIVADKFIDIREDFKNKIEFKFQDKRLQAFQYLRDKNLMHWNRSSEELREKLKDQEDQLIAAYESVNFEAFYEKHSIKKLNKSVGDRLKSYFKEKPEVIDMINLLQQYNNV